MKTINSNPFAPSVGIVIVFALMSLAIVAMMTAFANL